MPSWRLKVRHSRTSAIFPWELRRGTGSLQHGVIGLEQVEPRPFLLNPQLLLARTAYEWGVVAEVVPNGKAVARARELADLYLQTPEVTRRNTRIQPLKERIVRARRLHGSSRYRRKFFKRFGQYARAVHLKISRAPTADRPQT